MERAFGQLEQLAAKQLIAATEFIASKAGQALYSGVKKGAELGAKSIKNQYTGYYARQHERTARQRTRDTTNPWDTTPERKRLRTTTRQYAQYIGAGWDHGPGIPRQIKEVDVVAAVYNCDDSGSVNCINLINTGPAFYQRIGRKITLKHLNVSGYCTIQSAGSQDTWVRIAIVYDKSPNGALPGWTDVFQDVDFTGTPAASYWAQAMANRNTSNRNRFKVLHEIRRYFPGYSVDLELNIENLTNIYPSQKEANIDINLDLQNLETMYHGTLTTVLNPLWTGTPPPPQYITESIDSNPCTIANLATGSLLLMTYGYPIYGYSWNANMNIRLMFQDN